MEYAGRNGNLVLFIKEDFGAVVDEAANSVVQVGNKKALVASIDWNSYGKKPKDIAVELANAAMTDLDIRVFASNDRMYTIPDAVVAEAKRGLEWRKEENRGGTPVGLNTARTLARGGQIGIRKVRHIAKYFPRHEVDKKGKGYKPGQDNYPSNGRIAWALWGGDAAERWASAIVDRENKKKANTSITAGLGMHDYAPMDRVDYNSFMPSEMEPEFFIRIRLDGSGIDRLYKVEDDGACKFWDDGAWDDLGNIENDFHTYDKSLDDPYDKVQKIHTPVDRESAIKISAMLDSTPMEYINVQKIDFDETDLFEQAIPELDWKFIDQLSSDEVEESDDWDMDGLLAAGEAPAATTPATDGNYTPEERSENAQTQVRDKTGKFAKNGSTVVIGGDYNYKGQITAMNPEKQEVSVLLEDGRTVNVPANTTQEISTFEPVSQANFPANNLDFSGILGEPRVAIDEPLAQLPGRLPPLSAPDTNLLVSDWGAWVAGQRLSPEYSGDPIPPMQYEAKPDPNTVLGQYYEGGFNPDGTRKPGFNPATTENAYNDPLLRDWLDKKYTNAAGDVGYHNRGWYVPPKSVTDNVKTEDQLDRKKVYGKENKQSWERKFDINNSNERTLIAAGTEAEITPENSDVPPMFLAIVAPDDPQAVMELVCVVPANKQSTTPTTFKRKPGKWERDDRILNDLNSPTPPPVIVLDNANLAEVTKQIDGEVMVASVRFPAAIALSNNPVIASLIAAGGLDRNRGNAEKLRRYWTVGKGGLKVRWNSPGDWTRCHKYLAKYMGPRAKGYCALRHKEMTGMWPGDKRNPGMKKKSLVSSIEAVKTEESVISEFTLHARAEAARSRMVGRDGVAPSEHGAKFVIPLVIPENMESGDGRIFEGGSINTRDLPLPLLWQIKTGQGHDGSVVVGQILHMERTEQGIGNAYGVFDLGEYGKEAERLVRNGFIRGVSADMDKFEADEEEAKEPTGDDSEDTRKIESGRIVIKSARVMAVTIVPKPAFQECYIQIVDDGNGIQEDEVLPDGVYVEGMSPLDASALVACGMVAGAIPVEPPSSWFDNPKLTKATPLTVTDEGRVFGHIAAWHVDHIGMSFGTRPPRSRSKYAYFHTGTLRTSEGSDIPVGQLTLAGGHAGLEASAEEAVRHYDDTASAFADVHAGEDAYGIWVSGALRPGTTPEQIRAARASAPSGDWRPIKGHLELVAVCQVNVPGFPIARARVASGQVMALVAAGANVLAQLKHDPLAELNKKIDALEAKQNQPLVAAAEEAKARVASVQMSILEEKKAELAARVKKAKDEDSDYMIQMIDDNTQELAVVPRRVRERLAREKKAMPDGSFPIRNVEDLKNAIHAYGRAKPGAKAAVRKHITRRARGLDRPELIPDTWKVASAEFGIDEMAQDMRERIAEAMTAAGGLDRNRGNAERLRRYWTRGEGAAKIRWGAPGDWKRCVKHLAKYMGPRAKGYCQLRHKDALGFYTATHAKKDRKNLSEIETLNLELFGALFSNINSFETMVNPEDMAKDIDSILMEQDDDFDGSWEPKEEIVILLMEPENHMEDSDEEETADFAIDPEIKDLSPEEIEALKVERMNRAKKPAEDGKYTPETQPRDAQGKFRLVLARLKSDLGTAGLSRVVEKVEEAENLDNAGDYKKSAKAADDLLGLIERLDTKALNPEALENIRTSSAELGKVIANLPFAFGETATKIRFSDVPPALQKLMEDMIKKVEDKIGQEDADIATEELKSFMSGADYYNQSEISSQMAKLLRLLT